MSFAQIDALCRRLEALDHAQAMLGVDEAVNMPEGGGEKRAPREWMQKRYSWKTHGRRNF